MSIMDAKGGSRPGIFETVTDPMTGTRFTPVSGTGKRMTLKVNDTDQTITVNSMSMCSLRYAASEAGIIPPLGEFIVAVRGGKRGK